MYVAGAVADTTAPLFAALYLQVPAYVKTILFFKN